MSTPRDQTMAELRAWGAKPPGEVRADLVARAWRAGNRNIAALAEAARTTRQTIYTDLDSHGIDARDRTQETTVFQKIEYQGITGTADTHMDQIRRLHHDIAARGGSQQEQSQATRLVMDLYFPLRWHNTLVELLPAESEARAERDRALHQVEVTWSALSTTPNFQAAHHSWIVAHDKAHKAISAWEEAAQACYAVPVPDQGQFAVYAETVPGEQRLTPLSDPAVEAARLRTELDTEHERRRALTAQTLLSPSGQ
ncbi:hypothetical protein [Streptomyces sp. NRRL S-350]|uniref:hypothetical protein n=1 Tax=Streptomyces sp. NRRL S-350 TaxID=1463902 RepID=UPI00131C3CBA|nr:hypothetical protein [Streptomyces sp. NRRL S-350]